MAFVWVVPPASDDRRSIDGDPSATTHAVQPLPEGGAVQYLLTAVEGPDRGQRVAVDSSEASRLLVGTSPVCGLRLSDALVSRRHLAVQLVGRRLRLTDLESTNGTFVDGLQVLDVFLRGGETVRIGATAIQVAAVQGAVPVEPPHVDHFGKTIGASPAMRRLYPMCGRLAGSAITVIIEGETGTGKEVLAESIHEEGARGNAPFVVFDCAAVAPSLMESALFGHERGAFTGATAVHRGVFEQAHGGTLLIDEIGDLELSLQSRLLRVLQRNRIRRVGGDHEIPVDVRIIAATRRSLDHEVQAGRFRDDLFFRLAVGRVELPPLREREGDVALLASHFWDQLGGGPGGVPFEALRRYESYSWPGNVRELYNAVARLIALGQEDMPGLEVAAARGHAEAPQDYLDLVLGLDLPLVPARQRVVEEFERRYVARLLERYQGDTQRAATAAGIARRYFQILRARRSSDG